MGGALCDITEVNVVFMQTQGEAGYRRVLWKTETNKVIYLFSFIKWDLQFGNSLNINVRMHVNVLFQ